MRSADAIAQLAALAASQHPAREVSNDSNRGNQVFRAHLLERATDLSRRIARKQRIEFLEATIDADRRRTTPIECSVDDLSPLERSVLKQEQRVEADRRTVMEQIASQRGPGV